MQEDALKAYASGTGGEIVKLFKIAETATKQDERRAFKELLAYAKKHAEELTGCSSTRWTAPPATFSTTLNWSGWNPNTAWSSFRFRSRPKTPRPAGCNGGCWPAWHRSTRSSNRLT